jgi:DNA polymerase I-like protein with 3'-5' exonuclease and polymerase domains
MTLERSSAWSIAAIDIETKSLIDDPNGALIPHLSEITVIGLYSIDNQKVFRGPNAIPDLARFITDHDLHLVGHNFKFDLRKLIYDAPELKEFFVERWAADTLLMAHNLPDKVVDSFLAQYELARGAANDELPQGYSHRKAGPLSLKVLAPYFLGVKPFWEDPSNHDNDEYVLRDCEYTFRLHAYFDRRFREEFHAAGLFYTECQLPWTKMLLEAEVQGIKIDLELMKSKEFDQMTDRSEAKLFLEGEWQDAMSRIADRHKAALRDKYTAMAHAAVEKLKDKSKASGTFERYGNNYANAVAKMDFSLSFSSPKQLTEIMAGELGYDLRDFNGKISTGKEVLNRLADEGKEDVKLLLKYRKADKLLSSYFPAYRLFARPEGHTIHAQFNPAGARTGRLSSALPNMQQVAPILRDMFIARPGHVLITKDLSALEPVLIAFYSADPQLMEIVQKGLSFHCVNTKAIFNLSTPLERIKHEHADLRKIAKEFGLSVLYGAGAKRVQQSFLKYGVHRTLDECKEYVRRLRDTYAGVWRFKSELDVLLERGEVIYNYMGRPIVFNDPTEVYMKGFNRLIQGSGSDILQQAAFDISKEPGCQVLLLVHDELVVEVPAKQAERLEERVEFHMTKWALTNELGTVRLSVEGGAGPCWKK